MAPVPPDGSSKPPASTTDNSSNSSKPTAVVRSFVFKNPKDDEYYFGTMGSDGRKITNIVKVADTIKPVVEELIKDRLDEAYDLGKGAGYGEGYSDAMDQTESRLGWSETRRPTVSPAAPAVASAQPPVPSPERAQTSKKTKFNDNDVYVLLDGDLVLEDSPQQNAVKPPAVVKQETNGIAPDAATSQGQL